MASLTRAVGRGAEKPLKREVLLVQQLLNRHRPASLPRIAEDGGQGDETYTAIEEFQRRVMKLKTPDGRVDPDGKTWQALNQPPAVVTTPTPPTTPPSAAQPTGAMRISAAARALLRKLENLFLFTYDDQTGEATQVWVKGATIGYGHLIAKAEWDLYKGGITEAGANALLDKDLQPFEAAVNSTITARLGQNQFDALVILTFNIGAANLARSSVAKMVNDPTAKTMYKNLEAAWKSWNKSQGKVMLGLERRRQCEWNVYSLGKYEKNW